MLLDRSDAHALLRALGANERLLRHLQLVGEAADELMNAFTGLEVRFDASLIELGVAVHDAGKINYPEELDGTGSRHEPEGQAMMLANGVQLPVARCCVSHAAWQQHRTLSHCYGPFSDQMRTFRFVHEIIRTYHGQTFSTSAT
ncbi:hypothetical protein [Massilia pseudoviolaceinigra]|uniref:hypothetical protein n=1 Tax=Massilia pseudoviolaceinigra TaxID=3057165 RepID=UPI00279693EC|nr:hypothetical protein [Massilia sp. CCM 9206]MDQ1922901.1 hypothetical protein [Massilia sp. CCM 9206]